MAKRLREEEEKTEEEENSDNGSHIRFMTERYNTDPDGFDSDGSQIRFMNDTPYPADEDEDDEDELLFIKHIGKTAEDFNVLTSIEHNYYRFKEGVEKKMHTFNHIIFTVEKSGVEEVENVGGVWIRKN
jgi:hypothetical protein